MRYLLFFHLSNYILHFHEAFRPVIHLRIWNHLAIQKCHNLFFVHINMFLHTFVHYSIIQFLSHYHIKLYSMLFIFYPITIIYCSINCNIFSNSPSLIVYPLSFITYVSYSYHTNRHFVKLFFHIPAIDHCSILLHILIQNYRVISQTHVSFHHTIILSISFLILFYIYPSSI